MRWIILLLISSIYCHAQMQSGALETYLNTYLNSIPSSNTNLYQSPSQQQLQSWYQMIQHLASNQLSQARSIASGLNYRIVQYTDTSISPSTEYWIAEEIIPTTQHWGTYIFNPNHCRKLVLQAPHPRADTNTGSQAIYSFIQTSAAALFLAGTHRCNSSTLSTCSGTTSVCNGSSSAYPISDLAHGVNNTFQAGTMAIHDLQQAYVFMQLHGFNKQPTDPYVIMSYGARITPSPDYIQLLAAQLQHIDPILSFKSAHQDITWNRLIGFTNTQGRYINHSNDPCSTSASSNTNAFIHIEQERHRLRANTMAWNKLVTAINQVFSCTLSQASILTTEINWYYNNNQLHIDINDLESHELYLYDLQGKEITQQIFTSHYSFNTQHLSPGMYLAMIKTKKGWIRKKLLIHP